MYGDIAIATIFQYSVIYDIQHHFIQSIEFLSIQAPILIASPHQYIPGTSLAPNINLPSNEPWTPRAQQMLFRSSGAILERNIKYWERSNPFIPYHDSLCFWLSSLDTDRIKLFHDLFRNLRARFAPQVKTTLLRPEYSSNTQVVQCSTPTASHRYATVNVAPTIST